MPIVLDNTEPAIVRGIKTVGVGKKGSQSLSPRLVEEIQADLLAGKVPAAARGAFFAGLLAKGIEGPEQVLVPDPSRILQDITADAPQFVRWTCSQLICGHTLDRDSAYDLGKFLFSDDPGDGARGLVASFLRVRYETADEYEGLWKAMQDTIAPDFRGQTPKGEPIIQMAEPFDGTDHSYMITPLIGEYLQSLAYRVIHMVGRNSGPKLDLNVLDVAGHLDVVYLKNIAGLAQGKPRLGWFIQQSDLSSAVDRWVDIRRQTVKRPFLSTLEKFIKPIDARIMVTSAFHPPYGEKMLTMSERAGFPGAMVIRNGIEGSMGFPLKRPAKILLSARQADGHYHRHEITFDVPAYLGRSLDVEETRTQLKPEENARLIRAFLKDGKSGDEWFDLRVKATCAGFGQGLGWLEENMNFPAHKASHGEQSR